MPCYGCGKEGGSEFQLCRLCIELRKNARATRLQNTRLVPEVHDPLAAFEQTRVQVLGVIGISLLVFMYFFFFGPYSKDGIAAAATHGTFALFWALAAFTWVSFWMRLVIFDTTTAVVALLVPVVAYRHVFLTWEDKNTRILFVVHMVAVVIGTALAFNLPEHADGAHVPQMLQLN